MKFSKSTQNQNLKKAQDVKLTDFNDGLSLFFPSNKAMPIKHYLTGIDDINKLKGMENRTFPNKDQISLLNSITRLLFRH